MAFDWFLIASGALMPVIVTGFISWTSGVCVLATLAVIRYLIMPADGDIILLLHEKFGKSGCSLAGQVVWITGASTGSGAAIAKELAKSGVRLILSARTEEKLQKVKENCLALSSGSLSEDDVLVLPFDMVDYDKHEPYFKQVLEHFGKLDILICNAGRSQRAQWEMIDVSVDRALFDVDVFSLVALSRIAVRYFLSVKKGHVVVMSSTAGKMFAPYSGSYTGAKHALHGYFETLRLEKSKTGLHVTLLCPGPFESNLMDKCFSETMDKVVSKQRIGSMMTVERCAELSIVAVANHLSEAWISVQPVLLLMYLNQYLPILPKWAASFLDTEAMARKLRDGH